MKNTFYILLLFVVAVACGKKEDTVSPDAGTRVAGTYDVTTIQQSGQGIALTITYPFSTTINNAAVVETAQFVAIRKTESSVGITFTEKATGQTDTISDLGTLDIKGNDLYSGATKIGTADGNTLVFDATQQGVRSIITAKKR